MNPASDKRSSKALHGSFPDSSHIALLIIDMINDFAFEGGEKLLSHTRPVAHAISRLKQSLRAKNFPVIYINDNFGRWRSDFKQVIKYCLREESIGHGVVSLLKPDDEDYFVLKPKHSAFFATTLDVLLNYLEVESLIITGVSTEVCVLFTANDAYMRNFKLYVPEDCVASVSMQDNKYVLDFMRRKLKADTRPSSIWHSAS